MKQNNDILFDFDDMLLQPSKLSDIRTRKVINTQYGNYLPLMTAPMDTIISMDNIHLFKENRIFPVLPRINNSTQHHVSYTHFLSYGLDEFQRIFLDEIKLPDYGKTIFALIDVANGHMIDLFNSAKLAKELYGDKMCLMVGNVANPETFEQYCSIGVDCVRIGIGNGNGCLTTVQTGVGYPMASLIEHCRQIKSIKKSYSSTSIVADGGFKKYADVIKALALGADIVMLGSMLNKTLESTGLTTDSFGDTVNQYDESTIDKFNVGCKFFKTFRGMSTKDVQRSWGKESLTTSEGISKTQEVTDTLSGWVENFESYLKSAMSYCGKKELHQFIGGVKYNLISQNSFNRFNK